jgi:hypothetical protein
MVAEAMSRGASSTPALIVLTALITSEGRT